MAVEKVSVCLVSAGGVDTGEVNYHGLLCFVQAKQLQNRGDMTRTLQQCQDRSQQRFPLSDLLSVPIQRFLKYPLLVKVIFNLEHTTAWVFHTQL